MILLAQCSFWDPALGQPNTGWREGGRERGKREWPMSSFSSQSHIMECWWGAKIAPKRARNTLEWLPQEITLMSPWWQRLWVALQSGCMPWEQSIYIYIRIHHYGLWDSSGRFRMKGDRKVKIFAKAWRSSFRRWLSFERPWACGGRSHEPHTGHEVPQQIWAAHILWWRSSYSCQKVRIIGKMRFIKVIPSLLPDSISRCSRGNW